MPFHELCSLARGPEVLPSPFADQCPPLGHTGEVVHNHLDPVPSPFGNSENGFDFGYQTDTLMLVSNSRV